ncbi:MAG: ferredoxin [Thermosynechococcaceae cyanobacterium]
MASPSDPSVTQDEAHVSRSRLEPELGGQLRHHPERTGLEPELGGVLRQKGVYVDEPTCIGCKHCAHVARNTFYIEPVNGRSRAFRQDGDPETIVQEAIDTCPVDCIEWVDYTELKNLESDRKFQTVNILGSPVPATYKRRQKSRKRPGQQQP